ncbi:glutaredoxin family protein [Undibacterium sp. RuTC16W]|uniref:glutaredoxin family protein n=1 Tax=Undibacterium sp. RuTC16W TaxID=3413048 RepID=UPI003BF1B718
MKQQIKNWMKNVVLMAVTVTAAIAIGGNLPHFINQWRGPIRSGDFSAHLEKKPHRLTLYGTSTCPHCQSARTFLKQAGIAFNDVLIDESKEAALSFKQLHEGGVPVLVSQNKMVVGFDENAYDEIIKNHVVKQ